MCVDLYIVTMQQESGSFESEIEVCRNPFLFLPNNPECGGGEILESFVQPRPQSGQSQGSFPQQ